MGKLQTCIKCQAPQEPIDFRGVEIDRCTGCGGLWLDARELDALWDSQGEAAADSGQIEQAIAAMASLRAQMTDDDFDVEMTCPACAGRLAHIYFGDTQIEQCVSCSGIFLDRGELHKAMGLFDTGEAMTIVALARSVQASGEIG